MRRNAADRKRIWKLNGTRLLSLLVLFVLLVGIAASCSKKDSAESTASDDASPTPTASVEETPEPAPAIASFQGNWVNKNTATGGLTRLQITQNDTEVKVRAFGKCTPRDCDWGEESGGIIDNAAVLTWDQNFVIRKMTLTPQGDNELRCVLESVYNDGRPRQRSEEVFVKRS